jgi:chloramphenicol-sensitive protein RarD
LLAAVGAHILWGVFPLYFHLIDRAGAFEIVAHRIVWTFVLCLIVWSLFGYWPQVKQVLTQKRLAVRLLLGGVLVSANWLIYVYAVVIGKVVDAALGYFINPLVTVVLAIVFLKERLRRPQIIALSVGLTAVAVIVVGYGQFPWLGLGLALTFGLYSLAKNRIGKQVVPFVSLGVEASALAPFSAVFIVVLEATGQGSFLTVSPAYTWLLVGTGLVTAIPLLLFAVGASRLTLVSLALIQYLTPIMQFLIGVLLLHEQMPPARWAGFILIWVALVILTWDMARSLRRRRSS